MSDLRAQHREAAMAILSVERGPGALIQLDDLYEATEAECEVARNGVRWAVLDAKIAGLIAKTDTRGLYQTL